MPTIIQPDASAGKDNFLIYDAGYAPHITNNFGANTSWYIGDSSNSSSQYCLTLIQFPLTAIPSGATIDTGQLQAYNGYNFQSRASSTTDACYTHRMLKNWGEGVHINATATSGESCYQYYARPNNWDVVGAQGAGDCTSSGVTTINLPRASAAQGWITWPGWATIVTGWLNASYSNYGVSIRSHTKMGLGTTQDCMVFDSDNSPTASVRPKLTVTYHFHVAASATSAAVASTTKQAAKILAEAASAVASIVYGMLYSRAFSVASAAVTTVSRGIGKVLSAASNILFQPGAPPLVISVSAHRSTSASITPSLLKAVAHEVVVSAVAVASVVRSTALNVLSATSSAVVGISRGVSKVLSVVASIVFYERGGD